MSSALATMAGMQIASAAAPGGQPQTLLDFTPTFVIVAINLLILYFILNKLLFSRLTPFMEKRAESIRLSLEEAQKAKEYAEATREEYAEKIKQVHQDIARMMDEARATAVKEADEIIKNAKHEAQLVFNQAKEEIEKDRAKMVNEIRSEVAGLALTAASKVIEANLDNDANRKLVQKFLDEAGVA